MTAITAKPITATPITARPLTAYRLGESTEGANPLVWHALAANSSGVITDQLKGFGTPTWAHTSSLLLPDWEGIYRTIPAGTAPITGARKVENLLSYSEDFSNVKWAKRGLTPDYGHTDPNGGTTAVRLTENDTDNNPAFYYNSITADILDRTCSVWLKAESGTPTIVLCTNSVSGQATITLSTEWQRFSINNASSNNKGMHVGGFSSITRGSGLVFYVAFCQNENVSAQSNVNPSEYVPTTTAAASKFFNYENGNQVTSNVVTEAQGDPLTDWWFQCQSAKTNKALYSNDASNAAWVKTDMTGAKNAVGLDGAPNTGSTLTATGANATAIQTVTSASADHVARFFLRRKTGTGTVNICCDGSTWSEAVLTADYQEFMVLANTTNPQIGVQIVTSGDAVEMGNGECYTATIPVIRGSSPIITAASTVSTTAVYGTFDIANHSDTKGAYYCELIQLDVSANYSAGPLGVGPSGRIISETSAGVMTSFDGTTVGTLGTGTAIAGTSYKYGVAYSAADSKKTGYKDGAAGSETAYDGEYNATVELQVWAASGFNGAPIRVGKIRDIRRYNLSYAAGLAKLEEITA